MRVIVASLLLLLAVSCSPVGPMNAGGGANSSGGGTAASGGGTNSVGGGSNSSGGGTNSVGGGSNSVGGGSNSVGGGSNSVGGGTTAFGGGAASVMDAGILVDTGWRFIAIPGSKCALGAQAGIGYNPGATDELVIFLQGGGACWNTGTCHPSVYQWGPVCNYGMDSVCLVDMQGSTQPLAANVGHPNPFPSDGGGVFQSEIATVKQSLLFARRAENPLKNASYVYVPYCTGDVHSGNSVKSYLMKAGLFDPPVSVQHHFAGGTNMDSYLAYLRTQHAFVKTIFLTGVSGGGFGASLNLKRVRLAFPEAMVHLLADSAPMLQPAYFEQWKTAWNMQLPANCSSCDAGLPQTMEFMIDDAPNARVALLSYAEDQVITRFMYAGGTFDSWITNPPFGTYNANLVLMENQYEANANSKYFRLPGREHVMLAGYGVVQPDGGISSPVPSRDGGVNLKSWIDAWATGGAPWENHK